MKDERRVTYSDNHAFILNPSSFIPRLSFRLDREVWSGRRDLNSRPSPWQGDALPLSYSRFRARPILTIQRVLSSEAVCQLWSVCAVVLFTPDSSPVSKRTPDLERSDLRNRFNGFGLASVI